MATTTDNIYLALERRPRSAKSGTDASSTQNCNCLQTLQNQKLHRQICGHIQVYFKNRIRPSISLCRSGLKSSLDYGKSIVWPEYPVPPPLKGLEMELRGVFNRWRATRILRVIPRAQWPDFRLKLIGTDALLKKGRISCGINREWKRDYLKEVRLFQWPMLC